ncbi:unnamed protein product [Allacma fusca]|uniref:Uncharacterized protein n=1 Tax=Allacma fusca TaxID=39272 RepID=A0A8J2PQA1_9HEXA|nr:unnamed protein product [Allacma fusca]
MPEVSSTVYGPRGITNSTSKFLHKRQTDSQVVKENLSTRKFQNQESIAIEDSVKEILPIWLKPCKDTLTVLEFQGFTLMKNLDNFLSACNNLQNLILTNVTLLGSELENSRMKLILKKRSLLNLKQIAINGEGQLSVHELNVIDNLNQNYETSVVKALFTHRAKKKGRKSQKESRLIGSNVLINFLIKNSSSLKTLEIGRNPMDLYDDTVDVATISKIQLENFTGKGKGFRRILSAQFLLKSVSLIITEQDQDLFSTLIRNCSETVRRVELAQKYTKTLKTDQKVPKGMIQGRLINCQKLPRSLKKIIFHCDGFEKEQNDQFIRALPSFLQLESLCISCSTNNSLLPFTPNFQCIQRLLALPKIREILFLGCKVEQIEQIRTHIESRYSLSFTAISANNCAFRK